MGLGFSKAERVARRRALALQHLAQSTAVALGGDLFVSDCANSAHGAAKVGYSETTEAQDEHRHQDPDQSFGCLTTRAHHALLMPNS